MNYENLVKLEYQRQCGNDCIVDGGVHMRITARFGIPSSVSKRKASAMVYGEIRPTKKPDCDNIVKIICDALNGIAYKDDAQVVSVTIDKIYDTMPSVEVEIREEREYT